MKLLLKSAFLFFLLIFVFLSVKTVKAQTCVCQSDNNCHSSCAVYQPENRLTGVTYTSPYKCTLNLTNQWSTDPTAANKNSFCTRSLRAKGDADGTGGVDELIDFGYWFRGAILAKLPPGINPDFDGDGVIGNTDLAIWQAGKGTGVPPTPTPTPSITPGGPTLTPTPTGCPCGPNFRYEAFCNYLDIRVNCSCNIAPTNKPLAPLEESNPGYIGDWWTQCTKPKGDANKDGLVNERDFSDPAIGWATKYGTTGVSQADFNGDNVVDLIDFEIWRRNKLP